MEFSRVLVKIEYIKNIELGSQTVFTELAKVRVVTLDKAIDR